ncbi:TraB/GumN family protein [Pontiellaceae bacterium B12219]|nr:TraB/GumN family protein [Pontiellaceae bacterium B12219]
MMNKRTALKTLTLITIAALVPITQGKSTLWTVSSGENTLYIQGSSHVLKADNYPLAPAIENAYSNATALVLEVDMAQMTSPQTQQLILKKGMLTPPDSLQSALSPATYQSLEAACSNAGLPMGVIQQFKPWFATMTLTLVKMQQLGLNTKHGLDTYFFEKAVRDNKPVQGLETIDFQIGLFDSLARQNPDDFVNRALKDLDLLGSEIEELLTAWENGDLETLGKLMAESFAGYPELYEKFITARNRNWVKQLGKMIKDDQVYMVVVGAGHLPGDEGVINLLKKKGFSVEQL